MSRSQASMPRVPERGSDEPGAGDRASPGQTELQAARTALGQARSLLGLGPRLPGEEGKGVGVTPEDVPWPEAQGHAKTWRLLREELAKRDATVAAQSYEITDLRCRLAKAEAMLEDLLRANQSSGPED